MLAAHRCRIWGFPSCDTRTLRLREGATRTLIARREAAAVLGLVVVCQWSGEMSAPVQLPRKL